NTESVAGESVEDKGKRLAKLIRDAFAEVSDSDSDAAAKASIDAMMGVNVQDRLPIEAAADGVSFRAASPREINDYKKHVGFRGN
ncbi:MAG TPA: hypothetical protein VIV60_26790, partial [Polyangiaceae bacterium]